uniref:Subtilisin-like protease SBT5.3 n=1 Tax=Nicotiana sylvestris TaxID=4096 RepID=A0A1U7VFL5_NICSY
MEERKLNETTVRQLYNLSSLDNTGHGTHVAYTAAGSYVNNLEYYDLNMGTIQGGAPLARLAIYKVFWRDAKGVYSCNGADFLSAIDDAIRDGVDILSASLGSGPATVAEVHAESILGIGSFHAVSHGISVVAGGGNNGPNSNTIVNTSPWLITVAASNDDTQIVTPLTLGNNKTILVRLFCIWGDSEAFNDEGLGPIPSRWKGKCISEGNFNATKHCNRKIIGPRWYIKGLMEERKLNETTVRQLYNLSSLDNTGHGTHVAYTVAGSYVNNLEYYDLNMGTIQGGAPLARLAIYKVFWRDAKGVYSCNGADFLSAIDDAIRDGVDILSASLGSGPATVAEVHAESILGIGSFHAVSHGISVVAGGGNNGPNSNTIVNTSPWLITVAASNDDTQIVTPLTLGNNKTIL